MITDISSDFSKWFTSAEWYDFLGNCKAVLATESGTSIVDFDGSAEDICSEYIRTHPDDIDIQYLYGTLLHEYECGPQYRAIAPKHFEAAACHTLQIMYEGNYQNIFIPYKHYLPLKKDWSNFDEVLDILKDEHKRKEITDCAYEEIICNDKYSMQHFIDLFDRELTEIV